MPHDGEGRERVLIYLAAMLAVGTQLLLVASRGASLVSMLLHRIHRSLSDLEVRNFVAGRVATLGRGTCRLSIRLVDDHCDGVPTRLVACLVAERDGEVPVVVHGQADACRPDDRTRTRARRSEPGGTLRQLAGEGDVALVVGEHVVDRRTRDLGLRNHRRRRR